MSKSKPSKSPSIPIFKQGQQIEISSHDLGFRGSWFSGTVVRRSKENPSHYVIQYDKLFEDDTGKVPLQETLHWVQLRPPPPPTDESSTKFKFSDEVEAYHKDGWWEGVITEEIGDGKFAVFFRSSKEQIVFEEKELRMQREWINGKWNPPFGESVNGSKKFRVGMEVEVTTEEEGFEGAWFAATIKEVNNNKKYIVQYTTLRNEDDTEFLCEEVDAWQIRPSPEEAIVEGSYKLMEEVDAYYNECWWVGVVVKVLSESGKYLVFFRDTDEELEFKHGDLRPHCDWIGGKWIIPSQLLF
ncbi:Protein AGENET DOMAIN (AGD)-CONTAINING P1 [Linum perenne]